MDRSTELRRLALTLHKQPGDLGYLDHLDAAGLKNLRQRFQNRLIDEFGHVFEKLAGAGKLAPDALSAMLCKKIFGPAITANMSYYTSVETAIKLCKHFDADFMTEVAREQLPERSERMLNELPVDLMKAVTRQMATHGDFHIMGAFTDFMPEAKTMVLMEEVKDPADNLRISSFAQRKDRIAKLACGLTDAKLSVLIKAAFANEELTREIVLITCEMNEKDQTRMAGLTDALDAGYRQRGLDTANGMGMSNRLKAYAAA
jgi:hypothetical protein